MTTVAGRSSTQTDIGSLRAPDRSPFGDLAADYDRVFTDSAVGGLMRQAVWRRMDACFRRGDHVLELNCGTGEDAVHLAQRGVRVVATDNASEMLEIARAKLARAGVAELVHVELLAIEDLPSRPAGEMFDGALSNFGGLNCVADLRGVATGLAARLRPGAVALLCMMGPLAPWEWAWYLWRGQPAKAFRRLGHAGVPWRGLTIRYPSIRTAGRVFRPWFQLRRASALGALLPPSYAEEWASRHPRLLQRLNDLERRFETVTPLPWLADHYLLEMERL